MTHAPLQGSNDDSALYANEELSVTTTGIPGLLVVNQVLTRDGRGWVKHSYERDALIDRGFPADFVVHAERTSSIRRRGFTRGIHADSVSKYVSLVDGNAFAAFVDLRSGPTFGRLEVVQLTPAVGAFVPRGVGNSYQALTRGVQYTYLEERRTSTAPATRLSLSDSEVGIEWPIRLQDAVLLPDDIDQPSLRDVVPVKW